MLLVIGRLDQQSSAYALMPVSGYRKVPNGDVDPNPSVASSVAVGLPLGPHRAALTVQFAGQDNECLSDEL